jgi:hypothetical protein
METYTIAPINERDTSFSSYHKADYYIGSTFYAFDVFATISRMVFAQNFARITRFWRVYAKGGSCCLIRLNIPTGGSTR